MNNFADSLVSAIRKKRSYLIVGLDPRIDLIPKSLAPKKNLRSQTSFNPKYASRILLRFNRIVIDLIADKVIGIKPQSAFYECWGYEGVKAFWETMAYAKKKDLVVIADVKRGDVPSTAQAYAEAYLTSKFVDAITVNPLLGGDSLQPFIKLCQENGKGLFVLVKTSNPGSQDFQDQELKNGMKFYELIAQQVAEWGDRLVGKNNYSSLGAVVGATFPAAASKLRQIMPKQFFLIPGYGAQGGKASDLPAYFNRDGLGALVTAARSIIHSYATTESSPSTFSWTEIIQQAVEKTNKEIWNSLEQLPG